MNSKSKDFEKYSDSLDYFREAFPHFAESKTYFDIKTIISIPVVYLDNVDMNKFEESIIEQMWWSINSILYKVNGEDFYENIAWFMDSSEFRNIPLWILSRLIGGLLACKYCGFSYNENTLLSIAMNSAWTSSNQEYIMKQYKAIQKLIV
ncbi:hypothetical protein [uncultured Clostridium sp.]|uniref:hypothetical protein n=1 Tax=uncultured Clostridium sp. TaxID=59620 RepID=UPI002583AB7B|nr:hypothetical protein [uncultured Clostridium sp.]